MCFECIWLKLCIGWFSFGVRNVKMCLNIGCVNVLLKGISLRFVVEVCSRE